MYVCLRQFHTVNRFDSVLLVNMGEFDLVCLRDKGLKDFPHCFEDWFKFDLTAVEKRRMGPPLSLAVRFYSP